MLVDEIKTYAEELEEKHAIEIKTYAEKLEEKHAIEIKTYAEELEEKYTKKTEELVKKAEQERQNKLDFVRNLKILDVPIDKIVKASGLPLEVVEKL
jgi:aconitase B